MKITIVVPSYNQAAYLSATLASITAQDYPDMEVLVYDGGSSDGSVEILQRWAAGAANGKIVRWVSQKDGGQADAINRGLRESTGDVLAYLNSDDVYYPGALSAVAAAFQASPDRLVLYGRAHHLHADGTVMEDYPTEPWNYARLFETCFICQPAVFWRREVIERFGVFDDALDFALDYEYWLRVGRAMPFHYLDGHFLAGSRVHGDTKTLSQRVPVHLEIAGMMKKYASHPGQVLRWIKHLAHHRSHMTERPDPADTAGRRRFIATMAAHCLLDAHALDVPLDDAFLAGLEADLESVGC